MTAKAVGSNAGRVGEYFNWTLADENGKPMKNIPMKIGFNAVVYDEKNGILTDDNANAKLQINLGYKHIPMLSSILVIKTTTHHLLYQKSLSKSKLPH